ncbi:MAG TPA: tyrosine-type recombinase/integrase [Rhodanobacteraceae bacterium]
MKHAATSNSRIKHRYFQYLTDARGHDEATIDVTAKAIARFEQYTKHRPFQRFHIDQARAFKLNLADQCNERTGQPLSRSTMYSTLMHLKRFFEWLADQPGYRSRIHYADAEYFNPSAKDARIATAHRSPRAPSLEQLEHVVEQMPARSIIERRDRALVAFIALTGMRVRAVASMKLQYIDLSAGVVHQDARGVATKFAKTFDTFFFPVWPKARAIVDEWVNGLRTEQLFGNDDPLFPATRVALSESGSFAAAGLSREHWSNGGPIREIFRRAFAAAGLPYFNPHSVRHTLANLGERVCKTPEQFKAWSQNLGHEHVMTTFNVYGPVPGRRQGEILRALACDTGLGIHAGSH